MKIDLRILKFANHSVRNRPLSILFYIPEKREKLSPFDYQVYKLTNPKDKKLAVYSLTFTYYKVRTPEEWLQFIKGDALQAFQKEEVVHKEGDGPVITTCLEVVTKHVFPTKA
eukprot:11560705-Ditylum_brightwellii.AAC.2